MAKKKVPFKYKPKAIMERAAERQESAHCTSKEENRLEAVNKVDSKENRQVFQGCGA